jgi:DNA modification methylase
VTKVEMLGWEPGCNCELGVASFTPCVVLDPFAGSGTTLAVSEKLGRDSIGIELNPEYIKLAKERVGVTEDAA